MESSPGLWAMTAKCLKRSGDIIFEAYLKDLHDFANGFSPIKLNNLEVVGVATMLYGLSIENLLKGLIIKANGKPNSWPGSGHDQIKLSKMTTLAFDELEDDLFTRFTSFVEWAWKYKLPKKESNLYIKQLAVKENFVPIPMQEHEKKIFDWLFKKLWTHF